jgi:hypothetical protein
LRIRLQPLGLGLTLALVLVAAGCGASDNKSAATTEAGETGSSSPTQLALEHIRAGETQAARVSTVAQASPEGGGPTTVTIIQEGLADDSVAAVRNVLHYEPDGDGWRLVSAVRTQRCHAGRGHQNFAAGNCV